MKNISIRLSSELLQYLDNLVEDGVGSNHSEVMSIALFKLVKERAIQSVLDAEKEEPIRGDNLRELLMGPE